MSQLALGLAADVSPRHLSFLETGRAQPSREMVLRLGAALEVPLREQNAMLQAAGFPSEFREPGLAEMPPPVAVAVDRMLAQHEPFPLMVLSRRFDVLRANAAARRVFELFTADPGALVPPVNLFAFVFDLRLGRRYIHGWERLAHSLVARLHRDALLRPEDSDLAELLASLFRYEGVPEAWRQPDFSIPSEPTVEVRLARSELELGFLTAVTRFDAPQNVTLEEVRIESYFPADERTARTCAELARAGGGCSGPALG